MERFTRQTQSLPTLRAVLTLLAAASSLWFLPAAGAASEPQITDPQGDANGTTLNIDTRPASYHPADIVSASVRTTYVAEPVGADGVDYRATGLEIAISTMETSSESDIPLMFRFGFAVAGCSMSMDAYVDSTVPAGTSDREGTVEVSHLQATCPGAPIERTSFTLDVEGTRLVMGAPYASMRAAQATELAPGAELTELWAGSRGYLEATRPCANPDGRCGARAWAPFYDDAGPGDSFVVGSDVPPDVPCTREC